MTVTVPSSGNAVQVAVSVPSTIVQVSGVRVPRLQSRVPLTSVSWAGRVSLSVMSWAVDVLVGAWSTVR